MKVPFERVTQRLVDMITNTISPMHQVDLIWIITQTDILILCGVSYSYIFIPQLVG